jgi:hypothetical protein
MKIDGKTEIEAEEKEEEFIRISVWNLRYFF